jgi:TolB-like protein/Flp pilus assembly protein TadD
MNRSASLRNELMSSTRGGVGIAQADWQPSDCQSRLRCGGVTFMNDVRSSDRLIRFGPFEFNPASVELRRRGIKVRIQGQPLEVLAMLLAQPGVLVTRDALRTKLWPVGTFVDFEHGLNAAVRRLRRALEDAATTPRFVETLPRRGYRFMAAAEFEDKNHRSDEPTDRGRSVAVLPFNNATGDGECDYLVDGITERVISELSLMRDLRVTARAAVFPYKGSHRNPVSIGRSLGADRIVVGTVSQRDGGLLIHVELVDVARRFQLWGDHFERPLDDVTDLGPAIGQHIQSTLGLRLTSVERGPLEKARTSNGAAHGEYQKGRYFANRMTEAGLSRAIDHFGRAIAADSHCALAYSGLADCYSLLAFLGLNPPDEVLPKAREAACTALTLDDELAEAHASLASITKVYEWDWDRAEEGYLRALTLNPSSATAHRSYAAHLAAVGRRDESVAAIHRASELDPVSPIIFTERSWNSYMAREFDLARSQALEALDLQPGFAPALFALGLACEQRARHEEALEAFRAAAAQAANPAVLASQAHLLARTGRRGDAIVLMERLMELSRQRYVAPYWFAIVAAGMRDRQVGLSWLELAVDQHDVWLVWLKNEPRFDLFRMDRRFERVLAQVGFEPTRSAATS